MEKNILEEYQKRIEEVSKILEDNQEFVTEGIEASTERIDNRLTELQKKLEEAEMPIDMSDVGIGSLGVFVRDRRIATVRVSYSDDREGYLLSEYDKRRIDPDEPNANVERIVEEIRKEREAKRQVQRDSITAEMEGLIEKQEKLAKIHEFEIAKEQMTIEFREAADRIRKNINDKTAEMGEENQKSVDLANETSMYEKTLTLYQGKNHTIYTATKKELEKCRVKAEKTKGKAVKIARAIGKLTQDLDAIEKLLDKIQGIDKDLHTAEQSDLTWAEHEEEQRKVAEEQENEEDVREVGESISDEEKEAYEEFLHEGYEQDIKDAENLKKYAERQDKGEIKWSEKEEPSQEDLAEQSKLTETPEAQKPPVKQPTPVPRKWKIVNIEFSVEGGMQPTYKIVLSKGREQKEFIATDVRLLDEELDREEIKKLKHTYLIGDVESYYDKGLATALQQVDEIYGTDGFEQYRSLIKDKEMIDRYPNRYINSLEISYDFSGLLIEPDENMKKLQKLAKANLKKGVVTSFKGRPNFLTRFIKKLFMKPLLEAEKKKEKEKEEIVACKEEDSQPEFASQAEYRMAKLKSRSEIFKIAVKEAAKQQPETEPVKEEAKEKQPIAEERKSEEDPKAPEIPQPKVEELLEDGTMSYTDKEGKRVTIEYEDWITEPDDEEEIEEDSRKYKGYGWPMGRVYKKDDEDEIDEDEEEIEL